MAITSLLLLFLILTAFVECVQKNGGGLSLWIDSQQVKMFSGYFMGEIHVIDSGIVLPYILDPNFENYLPMIPSEVNSVNFTWRSGSKKYFYNFDILKTLDESILDPPQISIKTKGKIPKRPKGFHGVFQVQNVPLGEPLQHEKPPFVEKTVDQVKIKLRKRLKIVAEIADKNVIHQTSASFGSASTMKNFPWRVLVGHLTSTLPPISIRFIVALLVADSEYETCTHLLLTRQTYCVYLPCSGNRSGIAPFEVGLLIETRKGKPLVGTPLRLKLRKECAPRGIFPTGPDPECDKKCANGGWCNHEKICQCPEGYMGQYCKTALCYPQCMNGGNCTAPGVCSCPTGYQGRHCEGGICQDKCLNGGKCIQKDTCECPKGYFGRRCEYSKCVIPCLNGGKCKGANKCRCHFGYRGNHCEIDSRVSQRSLCLSPCRHGTCQSDNTCLCDPGWTGKKCHQSIVKGKKMENT